MEAISSEVIQKLRELADSVASIRDPNEVGNDDIRRLLEVFEVLIKHAHDPNTKDLGQVKRILRETRAAIAFLEQHPGPPTGPFVIQG